ncbi:MAG: DNA polymerase III subunit gamma/tau [Verrucomicrobiota bacterium]
MSYQVIARKYRPQKFSDVVGQEHVTQTLSNAIQQNRIAHAYLFVGPRGTGKTTIARIFAKALNCTDGPNANFLEDDPKCQEITEGRSLDVMEIDGASNRGIDEIRELRETAKYAPASSKFKIYIIDEVHMLTKEAFNALLKTLEEPPAHVKFMFATTEPEKVLPTILSRCQRFDLRRIPAKLIVEHLGYIAKKEGVKIDDAALHAIARGADGGMRDAESTLDQLISFCGNEIVEADVLSMFGLTAQSQIHSLTAAILAGEIEPALRELNDLSKQGKDLGRLLSELLNHFRNLLIYVVSKGDLRILEVSESEAAVLKEQSAAISSDALTRIMEVLTDCEGRLRDAASKKILIEVALLKAIEARNAVSIDVLLQQLQNLRPGNAATAPQSRAGVSPAPGGAGSLPARASEKISPPVTEKKPSTATPQTSSESASIVGANTDLEQLWSQLVESVGRASPFVRTYFIEAHPVSFTKNIFTIGFDPEFADHLPLVDNSRNHTLVQTKLAELGFPNSQVKFIKAETPADRVLPKAEPAPQTVSAPMKSEGVSTSRPSPLSRETPLAPKTKPESVPFNKDDFKNDPLIQKALEIFKGQIVDVRS